MEGVYSETTSKCPKCKLITKQQNCRDLNMYKIKRSVIYFAAVIAIISLGITGIGCGSENGSVYDRYQKAVNNQTYSAEAYCKDKESTTIGGGTLYSYCERQDYGVQKNDSLSIRYFVKAWYDGPRKVEKISMTWYVKAQYKRRTQESYSAGIDIGADSGGGNVAAGSSSEYVDFTSPTKSWTNTNGAASCYYPASNYVLYPFKQLESHSIVNSAIVKIAGYATPASITSCA